MQLQLQQQLPQPGARWLTVGAVRLGWRDTPQVRPCRLRHRIHAVEGPANPTVPPLDRPPVASSNSGFFGFGDDLCESRHWGFGVGFEDSVIR